MEICKLCMFFEGGISYSELNTMPMSEFFAVVKNANEISKKQQAQIKGKSRVK